jgi:hypothetical protein
MERSQLFDLMGELKLYGMKAAFNRSKRKTRGSLLDADTGSRSNAD